MDSQQQKNDVDGTGDDRENAGALDGITVLDAGIILQGPQAGQTLTDMGARVIKIELPEYGDSARWLPIAYPEEMRAPWFIAANRGKRSVTLDLRTGRGQQVFRDMARQADVVISNFLPGTMEAWGLGYADLAAVNPRIIAASASAYGSRGPDADRKGADLGGQSQGGIVSTTFSRTGGATPVAATVADHIGSQNLAIGILGALVARVRTGRGQHVETSLYGGQIFAQAPEITAYLLTGNQATTADSGHPLLQAFYGIFATADGHIALVGVPGAARRARLFTLLGRPELADEDRFNAIFLTPDTKTDLFAVCNEELPRRTTNEWAELLHEADIRFAPVNSYADIAVDDGAWVNGYLQRVDHPSWGPVTMVGSPISMSDTPVRPGAVAPELGQHTEEVLLEFGLTWDDIAELRDAGVL